MLGHDLKATQQEGRETDRARFIAQIVEIIYGHPGDRDPPTAAPGSRQGPIVLLEAEFSGYTYRLTRAEASSPKDLSHRQLRVVELVRAGLSNREIAESLGVGPATVCTHVARIFKKLGVHSRAQLLKDVVPL